MARTRKQAESIIESTAAKIPPNDLRVWVGGQTEEIFEGVARGVSLNIFDEIEPLGILNSKSSAILDFGCGCGRIARYLRALFPNPVYYGVDPDPRGIQWCRENLGNIGTFIQTKTRPPLELDRTFDFVYATSVFTHLDEQLQFDWLAELQRVTKPGGYLILTTHGENIAPESIKSELSAKGFTYRDAKNNLIGSDYIDIVWHSTKYIQENWGKYFEIVKHIDRGINNHQDLILCRKK